MPVLAPRASPPSCSTCFPAADTSTSCAKRRSRVSSRFAPLTQWMAMRR
ncbi:MAG: hypothetical protein MZV65_17100 [Chromatiales bacterium]|nr:hypothetical protein [Chromatiales bacterium]